MKTVTTKAPKGTRSKPFAITSNDELLSALAHIQDSTKKISFESRYGGEVIRVEANVAIIHRLVFKEAEALGWKKPL